MKKALICRSEIRPSGIRPSKIRGSEAGVTMILVAVCMVAIIGMAVLSINVVTLYLARMEAQRAADAAALAAARVISLSGITGDPSNTSGYWAQICGSSPAGVATLAAQAAAAQTVQNIVPTVTVTYSAMGSSSGVSDCTTLSNAQAQAFGINPTVIVQVTRSSMPTLFWQIEAANTVSATAVAEAFNPSNSASVASGGQIIPVQPRCVKPWMIPNMDPLNPAGCTTATGLNHCQSFVSVTPSDGHIINPGISVGGGNANGVIGEQFWLASDCKHTGGTCSQRTSPEQANYTLNPYIKSPGNTPNVLYLPGQAPTSTPVAVPSSGSGGSLWEEAIAGCDQTTVYQCGVQRANTIDLSENPQSSNDMIEGVESLTREATPGSIDGQDQINVASYPFQFQAGTSNPLVGVSLASGSPISTSNSIVTVPLYNSTDPIGGSGNSQVTIVGFLQVFINQVDQYSNVQVTVLNVSGCGNGTSATGTAVAGSSPVPVRLISR